MQIDKTRLNDIQLAIQESFNTGTDSGLLKARTLIENLTTEPVHLSAIRADKIDAKDTLTFVSSGLKWFDEMLGGGNRKQELVIIGGSPHEGKTHLMTWIAAQYAIERHQVLHFNGEDLIGDVKQIYEQILKKPELQYVHFVDVTDHHFSQRLIEGMLKEQIAAGLAPDVVVVDNLDIMGGGSTEQADWLAVSDLTKALRLSIAKKYNVILITASQLNFASGNNGQRGMGRFYRSKVGKASHADVIVMIEKCEGRKYDMDICKARGRRIFDKKPVLFCDWNKMQVEPWDKEDAK